MELLEESIGPDNLMTETPFSYTFFSTMAPGTQIAPHYGSCNIKLRLHFPLFVPECGNSYIRVGHETKTWQEGKMLSFDDTYDHEAGNLGKVDRVILLIDIWHPELELSERTAVKNMFKEVDKMIQ